MSTKTTAAELRDFVATFPAYEALPVEARYALVSVRTILQGCRAHECGNGLEPLIESGFLRARPEKGRYSVNPDRLNFVRLLRYFEQSRVFQDASAQAFVKHIAEYTTVLEREALLDQRALYWERDSTLFDQLTSNDWVQNFLDQPGDWERPYLAPGATPLLADSRVHAAVRDAIRLALGRGGPIPVRELVATGIGLDILSAALHGAFRYGLLFAGYDSENAEPVVGVWPTIKLTPREPAALPQKVTPSETFDRAFLLDDITTFLIACSSTDVRVRATDRQLFAKTVRDIAAKVYPLPAWVSEALEYNGEMRINVAASYARTFGMVEEAGSYSETTLAITERGRQWLSYGAGDRLRVLVDGALDRKQSIAPFADFRGAGIGPVAPLPYVNTTVKPRPDIAGAMRRAYRLQPGDFYPLAQVLAYSAANDNPLLQIYQKDKRIYVSMTGMYLSRADSTTLQTAWRQALQEFLRGRLLPLGCFRLGAGTDGISLAITPVGRYYLGETQDWESSESAASQVIVQPNFEVTFLGEAPAAEADLGRFAERRGAHMGALFQITKKSIFAAAAAGLTVDQVLHTLERVCTREVPANVRREIQGWFAQCRRVSVEPTTLIRCPDRETALRIIGLVKGSATPLNDTILEYKDPGKQLSWVVKKLKEMGVLVNVEKPARMPTRY